MAFKYKDYEDSEEYKRLAEQYAAKQAAAPGAYQSRYQQDMDALIDAYNKRGKFNYDQNTDPFFKQYEDMYKRNATLGQRNATAQSAAMTGGYGNSWAQTAGQQIYNQQMQGLNDVSTDLYNLALSRYQAEGSEIMSKYGMLSAADQQAYGRHRDTVADYQNELNRLASEMWQQKSYDRSVYEGDRSFEYGQHRDEISDALRQQEWDYAVEQDTFNRLLELGDYDALEDMGFDVTALETARDRETELYNMEVSKAQNQSTLDAIDYALATGDFSKLGDAGLGLIAIRNIRNQYENAATASDYAAWQIDVEKAVATGNAGKLKELGFADADIEAMLNPATEEEFGGFMNQASAVYDDDGNLIGHNYYNSKTGKEFYYELGKNPYTGKMNDDVKTDGKYDPSKAFSNGYQPNNYGGQDLEDTGARDTVHEREQAIFYTPDGATWIWDGEANKYEEYQDEDGAQLYYNKDKNEFYTKKSNNSTNFWGK